MQLTRPPMIHVLPIASRAPRTDVCGPAPAQLGLVPVTELGVMSTVEAARLLAREPATLQRWAVTGGPLVPVRINGRLGWRIADVQRLLTAGA